MTPGLKERLEERFVGALRLDPSLRVLIDDVVALREAHLKISKRAKYPRRCNGSVNVYALAALTTSNARLKQLGVEVG